MTKRFLSAAVLSLLLSISMFLGACKEKKSSVGVEDNGLTEAINELVPDSILAELEDLGMPINTGDDPPSIEGYFYNSPFVLMASNRPYDYIGSQYADYYVRFYGQNNKKLQINVDYLNGGEVGEGLGGFVVGEADSFSVFAELTVVVGSDTAFVLVLYTGKMTAEGITDMYIALMMLDNQGNPSGYFIDNGDGRIFRDTDGLSDRIEEFPTRAHLVDELKLSMSLAR